MSEQSFIGRNPSHFKVNPLVKAFITSELFLWSGWNVIAPIFAIFVADKVIGGSVEIAATAVSVQLIARVIAELVTGKIIMQVSENTERLLIIMGSLLVGFATLSFIYVTEVWQVYLFYVLYGVGFGIASPPKYTQFSTHLDPAKEATEWSIYDATSLVGMALAAAVGGFMAQRYGFQLVFLVAGILTVLSALPYLLLGEHPEPVRPT